MLAYVFWHWPKKETSRELYERKLLAFQSALDASAPGRFVKSATYRIPPAPWLPSGGYEDWYLIDGFTELGRLNEIAVSGARRDSHDEAARGAEGGMAGLYRLRAGEPNLERIRVSTWFSKPPGTSYEQLFAQISGLIPSTPSAVWQRQMTLGPTPELCIRAADQRAPVPADWNPIVIQTELCARSFA